jgi:hypothetical protein
VADEKSHYAHRRPATISAIIYQLRFKHDELCRVTRTDWVYGNESESTSRAVVQALNPLARQHARLGVGRVTPEILSRHDVNAGEKVIRLSRSQPEPVIQREPRLTGTR